MHAETTTGETLAHLAGDSEKVSSYRAVTLNELPPRRQPLAVSPP
jgi:hypothetical protein